MTTQATNVAVALEKLSDNDLLRQIEALTNDEHEATIQILHHLNEIERRRLDLDLGYSSLFDYCVQCLEYSTSAAGRRIQAARCIRRYPAVLPLLQERELNLSTISLIEPILTIDNFKTILERVRGASYRDVERIASEYRPPVACRDRVQHVRVAIPPAPSRAEVKEETEQNVLTPGAGSEDKKVRIEHKLLVQFLASEEFMALFEEVKTLATRTGEKMTIADVLQVALIEYRDRHSPAARHERRAAKMQRDSEDTGAAQPGNGARSRSKGPGSRRRECSDQTRHVPDNIKDKVFVRDSCRCTYVAQDGTRCESTTGLQVDHIRPFAAGGSHDLTNLRLLCAAHNLRAAERTLGAHVMHQFWRRQ